MSTIDDNLTVKQRLSAKFFDPPAQCIDEAAIKSTAQIEATKLQHEHRAFYSEAVAITTTTKIIPLHTATAAGTLAGLVAGNVVPNLGAATIVVDLKKNNVSVMSSTITLDNANTARVAEVGTLNPASVAYVAGDCFELHITATAGGGTVGLGFFAAANFHQRTQ